jgi:hypothetical protein
MVNHGGSELLWHVCTHQQNCRKLQPRSLLLSSQDRNIRVVPTHLPLWDTWLNSPNYSTSRLAVPWLTRLVARLSPRTYIRPLHVGFMMDKLGIDSFLRVVWFSAVSTTTPMLRTRAVESVHKSSESDTASSIFKTSDSDSSIIKTLTPTPS